MYADAAAQGRIAFNAQVHNFGEVIQQTKYTCSFIYSNTGTGTLRISRVRTSCGCTAVTPSRRELAPGEQGEIKVIFNSEHFTGNVVKHIYVHTTDPDNSIIRLEVRALVLAELAAAPAHIDFGNLRQGENIETLTEIYSPAGKPFTIEQISTQPEVLKTELEETIKGKRYKLHVRLSDNPQAGSFADVITVRTSITDTPLRIPVAGCIHQHTIISPQRIFFGFVNTSNAPERTITIRGDKNQQVKLKSVESPEWLNAGAIEVKAESEYDINLSIREDIESGFKRGSITLTLVDPEERRVVIDVFANINAGK